MIFQLNLGFPSGDDYILNKTPENEIREDRARFGEPVLIFPRLGQGSFRVLVTDAYERRCAVTNEKTLPALDAAHIKPYSESGEHLVSNGILLRRDLHALFDQGYVTINPSMKFEVSRKIKEEFENGRDYYRLDGRQYIVLPVNPSTSTFTRISWSGIIPIDLKGDWMRYYPTLARYSTGSKLNDFARAPFLVKSFGSRRKLNVRYR